MAARSGRAPYQPNRGDFIYVDFTPHAGGEMAGLRPALVLSAIEFNVATGRAFACPITNQVKGGPWEIPIPPGAGVTGVVVVSEAKMIDWLARGTAFRGKARPETLDHVIEMIGHVLGREW